jgi:hypothetical protein
MREAKRRGARTLGLVNVVGSTIAREDDGGIYLHAGPEIGVASHQGVHQPGGGAGAVHAQAGAPARHGAGAGARDRPGAGRAARADSEHPRSRARDRGDRRGVQAREQLPVPRPRLQLPGGARRRAQAQGNQLHPRRGLSGGRDEARPDRAHRRDDAGGVHRAARRGVREDRVEHPGSEGAQGQDHRHHHARGRRARGAGGLRVPRARNDRPAHAGAGVGAAAAAGVLHRREAWVQRGPAAQPGQVGDGGVPSATTTPTTCGTRGSSTPRSSS